MSRMEKMEVRFVFDKNKYDKLKHLVSIIMSDAEEWHTVVMNGGEFLSVSWKFYVEYIGRIADKFHAALEILEEHPECVRNIDVVELLHGQSLVRDLFTYIDKINAKYEQNKDLYPLFLTLEDAINWQKSYGHHRQKQGQPPESGNL